MVSAGRKYCIFGCADLGAHMHSFPHYIKRPDMFQKWVSIVGSKLTESNPLKIYKNKKVCDYHFTSDQKVACHRLMLSAEPSVNLEGIFMTPAVSIRLEHNYSIPGVHMFNQNCNENTLDTSNLLQLDSTIVSSKKGLVMDSAHLENHSLPVKTDTEDMSSTNVTLFKHSLEIKTAAKSQITKLRAHLHKTKKSEPIYKTQLKTMKTIFYNTKCFAKVIKNKRSAAKHVTVLQFHYD